LSLFQASSEVETLKKSSSALEAQMKELRIKAKLKITQLNRELEGFRSSPSANSSPNQSSRPSMDSLNNSNNNQKNETGDKETTGSEKWQAKVDELTTEVQTLKEMLSERDRVRMQGEEEKRSQAHVIQELKKTALEEKNALLAQIDEISLERDNLLIEKEVSCTPNMSNKKDAKDDDLVLDQAKRIEELESLLEEKHAEIKNLSTTANQSMTQNTTTDDDSKALLELESLKKDLAARDLKIQELELKLEDSSKSTSSANTTIPNTDCVNESAADHENDNSYNEKSKLIDSLKADIESKDSKIEVLTNELKNVKSEMTNSLEPFKSQISTLTSDLQTLQTLHKSTISERDALHSKLQQLELKSSEPLPAPPPPSPTNEKELMELKELLQSRDTQLSEQTSILNAAESQIQGCRGKIESLQKELQESQIRLEKAVKDAGDRDEVIVDLKKQIEIAVSDKQTGVDEKVFGFEEQV
jgi:chromosome segregation ATPase